MYALPMTRLNQRRQVARYTSPQSIETWIYFRYLRYKGGFVEASMIIAAGISKERGRGGFHKATPAIDVSCCGALAQI